ncbi:MAG: hypothetical protein U9Q78_05630 [Chloroflexota bacterium]|nr:hypothetical protein [Chloroflexota bacterium]
MINWMGVGVNALWVLGAAGILASLSYTSWWAHERGVPLRRALGEASFQLPFFLSIALICGGLFFCARNLLERVLWLVLFILFVIQAHTTWREAKATNLKS